MALKEYLHFFSLKDDYLEAVRGIQNLLLQRTSKSNLLFIGELKGTTKEFVPKMVRLDTKY